MRYHVEHRCIALLPAGRSLLRNEAFLHFEAGLFFIAPPATKAKQLWIVAVPLMHKGATHAARARVEVFVRAPAGKVYIPVMQLQRNIAYRMRQVEPSISAYAVGRLSNTFKVEE